MLTDETDEYLARPCLATTLFTHSHCIQHLQHNLIMTKIHAPASLPHPVSAFLHAFYRASDTSPADNPAAHQLYADFFLADAPLLMGGNTFNGRDGFIEFREKGWEKVAAREHVVLDVFPKTGAAAEGEDAELMVRGTVDYGMKDGSAGAADWAGYMKLRWMHDAGGYKLAFYQVWLVSLPVVWGLIGMELIVCVDAALSAVTRIWGIRETMYMFCGSLASGGRGHRGHTACIHPNTTAVCVVSLPARKARST